MDRKVIALILVGVVIVVLAITKLAGCSLAQEETPTPTVPTMDVTQAYQTVIANLTQVVTPIDTLTQTPTPHVTEDGGGSQPTTVPTSPNTTHTPAPGTPTIDPICDKAAAGNPIDVTIPDDTEMSPGESFTKIWRLVNVGSCTWTEEYTASFFYGDKMGASDSVSLPEIVNSGQQVEIEVEMVAPDVPDTYQGNWKLSNASNELFGIGPNGDSPFWVRIVVVESSGETPTPTELPTFTATHTETPPATATPTITPPVEASGPITMSPGDSVDLDTGQINVGIEDDLSYQTDAGEFHWLAPQAGAVLGVYGNELPGPDECGSANMSTAPIPVESLPMGTYLCYRTNMDLLGRTFLVDFDDDYTLHMEILTWASP
jgi:hypothetical protein